MKWPKLPTGADKPSWASLFGSVSMIYLFVDPYQKGAPWSEWVWTGLAFLVFLALSTVAAIYWSRKRVMQWVCIGIAALAIAFTSYRPSGICFYIFVAALAPFAVGGDLRASASVVIACVIAIFAQWRLNWPPSVFPYVIALETFLVGIAFAFVARQQAALRRTLKTAERERIARDLHDILGHTLSVIILKAELASRLMEQDPQRASKEIQEVERISRSALSEVREAITGYRAGDLLTELERAKSTLETAGVTVERHCEPVTLPIAQERVLTLVLREAVTNILRHAHATRCRMTLQQANNACRLQIRDDGRGGAHQEGNGMRGIRERVDAIGGLVAWKSEAGTELTITVPLAVHADGESA